MTPLAYFNGIPLRYVGNIMHFYQGGRAAYFGKGGLPEGPQKEQEISSKGGGHKEFPQGEGGGVAKLAIFSPS